MAPDSLLPRWGASGSSCETTPGMVEPCLPDERASVWAKRWRQLVLAAFLPFAALGALAQSSHLSQGRTTAMVEVSEPEIGGAGPVAPGLQALYAERAQRFLWLGSDGLPTMQAYRLLGALDQAASKGLAGEDYGAAALARRATDLVGAPATADLGQDRARFELDLTAAVLQYALHLHQGRVDPRQLGFALDAAPKQLDVAALLSDLATSSDPLARLAEVEPPYRGYRRLQAHLARYLELAASEHWPALPNLPERVLEPGEPYSGAEALATRLTLLGDLVADAVAEQPAAAESLYHGSLVAAVERFQRRHGLLIDGRLGAHTLAALNVTPASRVHQIELALERWRWVPIGLQQPPIVVNIPEFRLRAFGVGGKVELEMPVVVGAAFQRQTPIFAEQLRTVVFRPYWNVPLSILRRDLLPRHAKDPTYFERHGFEIIGGSSQSLTAEVLEDLRRGRLGLRQNPGPANALGRVKFLFPNAHAVYLHDTPATGLFARARRDLSSGCIRVEAPAALAAWVLRQQPDWTAERIRAAMEGSRDDQAVAVSPPIPVFLVYLTAVAPEGGELLFFEDIYGHDATLLRALAEARSRP